MRSGRMPSELNSTTGVSRAVLGRCALAGGAAITTAVEAARARTRLKRRNTRFPRCAQMSRRSASYAALRFVNDLEANSPEIEQDPATAGGSPRSAGGQDRVMGDGEFRRDSNYLTTRVT